MRHVVIGAGAIGLLVAAGLLRSGAEVVVVARGGNAEALRSHGLTYVSPQLRASYPVTVVEDVALIVFEPDDVVHLAVKSQAPGTW